MFWSVAILCVTAILITAMATGNSIEVMYDHSDNMGGNRNEKGYFRIGKDKQS